MGNMVGSSRQLVDEKYTRPQGLRQHKDLDHKKLRKLILESKLAPCYPSRGDLEECPMCFLHYPSLNRSRCCKKGICTECFLQLKSPNSTLPSSCPFCKTVNYAVEYTGVRTKEEKGQVGAYMNETKRKIQATSVLSGNLTSTAENPQHGYKDVDHLKICLQKLTLATNNFNENCIIGKGGFGMVYKAQIERHTVAVKRLHPRSQQGHHEFNMELTVLSAYAHKNLVTLTGFCKEDGEKILVYKYESNGSLDERILRKDLTWIQLLRICLDTARGLTYLHDDIGTNHKILHCDIKSSNILLDENFNAKISDFGLSKLALSNVPITTLISHACGTPGYCDPDYYEYGILTQKSDVYSFGVVMFEVLCGKVVGRSKHLDEYFSAKLAQNHYVKETLDEIIGSNLRNQMNSASLTTFSTIAHKCLKCPGKDRPTMSVVVEELQKALDYQQVLSWE